MTPAVYAEVPEQSRDSARPYLVRWGLLEPGTDPFLGGVYAAAAWAYDQLFGPVLGALLYDAVDIERWDRDAGKWVNLA